MSEFKFSDDLWAPQLNALKEVKYHLDEGVRRIILQSPTGSGKTRMALELFQWMNHLKLGGNFYVNRKFLVGQTFERMQDSGLWCGVRAADYDDKYDEDAPFQVTSVQTEDQRCYKSSVWDMHHVGDDGLVVVDEGHMQKTKRMKDVLDFYERNNARVVILTATPINMAKWADALVVSAKIHEWRNCGALVLVHPYSCKHPDLSKVEKKRNKDGEFVLSNEQKKSFTQHIVGDVMSKYEELTQGGPCFMYCPGVAESKWLSHQMTLRGHEFIHVDSTECRIAGKPYPLNRDMWKDIIGMIETGKAKGLSCRFKLREGIDIPAADHCILATPVGSLASYLQICGRVMRASPSTGKTHAILQDHGAVYWTHGSPNNNRDWESLWQLSDHAASTLHKTLVAEGDQPEPIRCPECGRERLRGPQCECGYRHEKSVREIIMEDGEIKMVEGNMIKKKVRRNRNDTQDKWTNIYYGYKNKKVKQTFLQMEANFFRTNFYWPERNLKFMPRRAIDWKQRVCEVPMSALIGYNKDKVGE